jgi:transcription antitermination factor NusG
MPTNISDNALSLEMTAAWYAVYTRAHLENRVAYHFLESGITHYLPLFQEMHQWSDRSKHLAVPVFPGYLFARFCASSRDRVAVLSTFGVVRILGRNGRPDPIPDSELDAVKRLLATGEACRSGRDLMAGTWVRVVRGPLRGVEGRLVRHKSRARLRVTVSMLNQSVEAEIDAHDVVAARNPAMPAVLKTPL